jgi:hypothetical protein
MPAEATAQDDRATSVTPAIRPSAPWRVREVTALPGDRLFVRFVDGLYPGHARTRKSAGLMTRKLSVTSSQ